MTLPTLNAVDYGLRTQAWVGVGEPDPGRVASGSQPTIPRPKPSLGFFTSTWDSATGSSAWLEFLRVQSERAPRDGERLWLLDPAPQAVLFVVDSLADFAELVDAYPHRGNERNPIAAPDWRRVAEAAPFDAVHVTNRVLHEATEWQPGDGAQQFYGWDVESTLWLRWQLGDRQCLGSISQGWIVAAPS